MQNVKWRGMFISIVYIPVGQWVLLASQDPDGGRLPDKSKVRKLMWAFVDYRLCIFIRMMAEICI